MAPLPVPAMYRKGMSTRVFLLCVNLAGAFLHIGITKSPEKCQFALCWHLATILSDMEPTAWNAIQHGGYCHVMTPLFSCFRRWTFQYVFKIIAYSSTSSGSWTVIGGWLYEAHWASDAPVVAANGTAMLSCALLPLTGHPPPPRPLCQTPHYQ